MCTQMIFHTCAWSSCTMDIYGHEFYCLVSTPKYCNEDLTRNLPVNKYD